MAQAISAYALTPDPNITVNVPAFRFALADQTATTAAQDLGFANAGKFFKTIVWLKTSTNGTGTVGPIFELQVADDSGFTTNVRTIALDQPNKGQVTSFILEGVAPDGGRRYTRLKVTFNGTDTGTFDAYIDAV